jgi:hypothetical protein
MARINIEECWWSDPRRSKLIRLLGGDTRKADGLAIEAWRLAQEFWKHGRQLVPNTHFQALDGGELLIESGLAVIKDDAVYIRGSSQYLEWVHEEREARRLGGINSANRPRDEKGRLLPKETPEDPETPAKTQLPPSSTPAEPSSIQVSVSVSGSNKEEYIGLDFEKIYRAYPKRKGSQHKAKGLEICRKKFNQPELYEALLAATINYAAFCKKEKYVGTEFVSRFVTFVGGIWEEWVPTGPPIEGPVQKSDAEIEAEIQEKRRRELGDHHEQHQSH